MSATWTTVVAIGLATIALKAAGPVLLGGRTPGPRLISVLELLAPALLAALVVTQVFAGRGGLVLDERLVGVAAAALALVLRAPLLVVVVVAAVATAVVRAL